MMEIGGYLELDEYRLPCLHEEAIALNCGRSALAYLIEAREIKKIALPRFLCHSLRDVCHRYKVEAYGYPIDSDFMPTDVHLDQDEWLLLVNYYGQLDNDKIKQLASRYGRVIVDNTQAFYQDPVEGIDTFYSCRKYFGVSDGAFLYTDTFLKRELPQDESFEYMRHLLGRYERTASEFYAEYVASNERFDYEPLKRMSKLTTNLLHAIDYEHIRQRRTLNFRYLHEALDSYNKLSLHVPEGAFMYPFYVKGGAELRVELQRQKIYIPTLWPDVLRECAADMTEYDLANNILPLPCDQRYGLKEMEMLTERVMKGRVC